MDWTKWLLFSIFAFKIYWTFYKKKIKNEKIFRKTFFHLHIFAIFIKIKSIFQMLKIYLTWNFPNFLTFIEYISFIRNKKFAIMKCHTLLILCCKNNHVSFLFLYLCSILHEIGRFFFMNEFDFSFFDRKNFFV